MLASDGTSAAIVVGRTLTTPSTAATSTPAPSYFVGEVENNQVTITYTVYNEQADPETGVLLTTTLEPGVTFLSSSVMLDGTTTAYLPDQSGQNLAFSLGAIQGYDRESVAVTVSLANPIPLQLDSGANAYATLDAGTVSASTPAATLQAGTDSDPSLLASTVDADTNDPYIQEEAAALGYNAQNIFNFLHDDIGYNAYSGSVRGARGTLWSDAGNSLDVASLGVALMRASGIPAQYVSGTLSQSDAQELILSMFPASDQTVGYVPSGTQTSDPANDPQLLSETESHYWFQFDTGSGMTDADPLMPGATIDQTFTTSTGTFSAVPADLEQTTEVQLVAEIYSQASALFGLSSGFQDTTVLDQTFDDTELVGRPLTIGNLVSTSSLGALVFSSTTNTYTPYIVVGDEALADSQLTEAITGQQYQEVLTNFPLGSQILTGLFLNITLSGPGTTSETFSRTLVDRIGYAARQGLAPPENLSVDPSAPPIITPFNLTTVNVLPGLQSPAAAQLEQERANQQLAIVSSETTPTSADQSAAVIALSRSELANFSLASDGETANLASGYSVAAYFSVPRIALFSSTVSTANNQSTLSYSFDLVQDSIQAIAAPGQNEQAAPGFAAVRGIFDSLLEAQSVPVVAGGANLSSASIVQQSIAQGIPLVTIGTNNLSLLQSLNLPADAVARITTDVQSGLIVLVPAQAIVINGSPITAWYVGNPTTGEILSQGQDGGYQGLTEYTLITTIITSAALNIALTEIMPGPHPPAKLAKAALIGAVGAIFPFTFLGILGSLALNYITSPLGPLSKIDPSVANLLVNLNIPNPDTPAATASTATANQSNLPAGQVSGTVQASSAVATGALTTAWQSSADGSFVASSVGATGATVVDSNGTTVGSGAVALSTQEPIAVSISGNATYSVSGQGSLSFYGPSESNLGVSGTWTNYSAIVTGNVSIVLTTDGLTLNGQALPAGTYTITTSSATLSGGGTTSSPNFTGAASITATGGTIELGPGTGRLALGGKSLDPTNETTLTGYNGAIDVSASGQGADAVSLNGSADNALEVSGSPGTLTANQNTPVTFLANLQTTLADTYNLTVTAPTGWTVTIDASGNVAATPAPGLQSGTYPIQIIAQSSTDPDLVAQSAVNVTITPTQPGMDLSVAADPIYTVPLDGAGLPTAFRATIQNLGPDADTYNLSFSGVPSGFTLADSGTSVTVPPGATGILGLYLIPNTGQALPAPGTVLSFQVSAVSNTDSSITQTQTVNFTVPAIDALTVTSDPTSVNTIPGVAAADTVTITNVGNVAESSVSLSATTSSGLTLTGLTPLSLAVGQSTTETVILTPDSSTPLNSQLQATITATFGVGPSTQTLNLPVNVVVPGAAAIANAAVAAGQLGNTNLADRLNDLSTALTSLVENPTSPVYQSEALASLTAVDGLLSADPYLAALFPKLTSDGTALSQATTAAAVQAAVSNLGNDLDTVGTTLSDEAASGFTFGFVGDSSQIIQPLVPASFQLQLQNTGSQTTTYNLSLTGLPAGVTGTLSQTSITLAPGEDTPGTIGVPVLTVAFTTTSSTALAAFTFTVTATAQGAPEITQSIDGSLTARTALVQVISVTPNPTFTNPGGQVDVSAVILNAVNQQQQAEVSYSVTDSNGNVIFTSVPVTTTLNVLTTLSTVDLGDLDTTGFALGDDTITVTVSDASGNPIAGATGTGTLLIGSPVTATLATSPATLPAGGGTVTETLQVGLNPEVVSTSNLVGQVSPANGADTVASYETYAYVGGNDGISIVDMSNPAEPTVASTFGGSDLASGYMPYLTVSGDDLYVNSSNPNGSPTSSLLIYSLANPLIPQLLGQTTLGDYSLMRGITPYIDTADQQAYMSSFWLRYYIASGAVFEQHGQIVSVDISDPTNPTDDGVIFNLPPSDYPDGDSNIWQESAVNADTLLAASTTNTGSTLDGTGLVMVIDTTDPSNPSLVSTVPIPGTVGLIGIAQENGDMAVALGTTGYWSPGPDVALTGDLVLTTLDESDPTNPTVVATVPLNLPSNSAGALLSLGNDEFITTSENATTGQQDIVIIDATDPNNPIVSTFAVPTPINGASVSGNLLYTTSSSGLLVYNLAGAGQTTPVTAQVTIPTGNGVSIVPGSFSIAPSNTVTGTGTETLEWDFAFGAGNASQTITWQEVLTGLAAGQSLSVVQGATVDFGPAPADTFALPGQVVTGDQIIGLDPATETVAPGAPAAYTVNLANPTDAPVTYALSVLGLPSGWVDLAASVTVAGNSSTDVSFTLTSASFAALADYGFTITANGDNGAEASVLGDLVLQGSPVAPDPESHGIVATLTPTQATAGQGTSARYLVQLTNTGSADDTFSLEALGLPSGVTATFSDASIDVPPGASNFRDVTLTLTPQPGTAPASYPFTVMAASSTDSSITGTANGTLTVTAGGVTVTLSPGSGSPGSSFEATVTNTGTTTDTYNLTLAGPAALVSSLGTSTVTLAPGASQMVPISTGAVDFAVQGSLPLTAAATSMSNPAIQGSASTDLSIPATQGMTAEFSPASQTLSQPGMVTFLLMVHNTGNSEDSYSATIMGTNGPVTATLVGLDGSPTQSISTFILPGLSTGAIELEASLASLGTGTITVDVQSLTNSAISASLMASVTTVKAVKTPPPPSGPRAVTTDAPEVTQVLRYGYHEMPTTLVISFNEALDAATAQDPKNYRIIGPEGGIIRVKSAVYNASTETVTLHPKKRISVHYRYTLIVDGAKIGGVKNTSEQLLDGAYSGKPGSNYRASLTWRNLVLDPKVAKRYDQNKDSTRSVKVKSEPAEHVVGHEAVPFTRARPFRM